MAEKNKCVYKGNRFWIFCILPALVFLSFFTTSYSQEYRALNGSIYAGSLAALENPASIVNLPYTIDFTPLAFQVKYATNSVKFKHTSYLPKWTNAEGGFKNGTFERNLLGNTDIRLLNTRIRLSCNSAISFGISGRANLSVNTSSQTWHDTIITVREFMRANMGNTPLSGNGRGIGWAEYYGTYARTIKVYPGAILNTGLTVKYITGLAGIYFDGMGLEETAGTVNNLPGHYLTNGNLNYGYSANMDVLDTASTFGWGLKGFLRKTNSTFGISLGAEYIVKGNNEIENGNALKLGIALLDLGKTNFEYSTASRRAVLNKQNVSDTLIQLKFEEIVDVASFSDSLQTIAGSIDSLKGNFNMFQPARLVLNADKHLRDNFFVNASLTIPISGLVGKKQLFVQEMNLLNLSLRYETKQFGLYLPASLNTKLNFWIGGAVRTGPLLLGFHNLANLISKNKIHNGGAYLALTFRLKTKKEFNCDSDDGLMILNKQLKQLRCPPNVQ